MASLLAFAFFKDQGHWCEGIGDGDLLRAGYLYLPQTSRRLVCATIDYCQPGFFSCWFGCCWVSETLLDETYNDKHMCVGQTLGTALDHTNLS